MKKIIKFLASTTFIWLLVGCSTEDPKPKEAANPVETQTEQPIEKEKVTWNEKVREIADENGTETEKFDQISSFAREYKPTEEEVKQFQDEIIKEYKENRYIMDISNHEYMLGNIFKSDVVLRHYKNDPKNPMGNFAMNFWQNSKYNYRGVENMTSESTLINEKQMDKALEEIGK
jgi:hypothetical protein